MYYKTIFMRYLFLFFMLQFSLIAMAQNRFEEVDKRVKAIPSEQSKSIQKLSEWFNSNFEKEEERYRAIFFWVANNLVYDIKSLSQPAVEEPKPVIVKKAFERRMAVCEGYSGLMDTLCQLSGITTALVSGYTRNNGQLDITPHMWMAAYINGEWTLSDPTWASGAIMNNKFVKQFEEKYFLVPAQRMIQSHIPYDPMWQLLKKPLTHKAFIQLANDEKNNLDFNFNDSIYHHLNADKATQYQNELRRIRNQGFNHQALGQRLNYLEGTLKVIQHNETVAELRIVTDVFNQSIELFNSSVNLLNNRADSKSVNTKLHEAKEKLFQAKERLLAIEDSPAALNQNMASMMNSIKQLEENIQQLLTR
jgi:hypothetical protein